MNSLSRRQFNRVAGAAAVVAGFGPASGLAQAPMKIRASVVPIIDTAALHAAIQQGFFAAEGLEVDLTPTAGGAVGLPALAAGQVQVAFSNIVSTILGAANGLGFKIIAPAATAPDTPPEGTAIVAAKGKGFKTGKDLEGKRVAVNNRANVIWLYSRAWVEATGGNPDRVTYLEIPFPQMTDAIKGGQIDAGLLVDPFLSAGLNNNTLELVGWPYNTVQKGMSISHYAATDSFIKANPAVIAAFVRGLEKGIDWMNANAGSPAWLTLISGFTKLPEDRLKTLHVAPFRKVVEPKSVQDSIALMRKHGMLQRPISATDVLYVPARK
jgi:NitT/TauT family transport system substrate-binding protein